MTTIESSLTFQDEIKNKLDELSESPTKVLQTIDEILILLTNKHGNLKIDDTISIKVSELLQEISSKIASLNTMVYSDTNPNLSNCCISSSIKEIILMNQF